MEQKVITDIFTELGRRLESFGRDDRSREVIARAVAANPWFTPEYMVLAIRAIGEEMLRRPQIERWLGGYGALTPRYGKKLGIIMAGNIPFAGFLDLMCGLMCGYECYVHTSSKDRVGMQYIFDLLEDISDEIHIRQGLDTSLDALIASGSDETIRAIHNDYLAIPSLLRGSRSSVAVLSGHESDADLRSLADDVFTYCGLGCRNVSLIFVPRGYAVHRIAEVFMQYKPIHPKFSNNYLQNKALSQMNGTNTSAIDGGFFTLRSGDDYPVRISEIAYAYYDSPQELDRWMERRDDSLQCVVTDSYAHPSAVAFGRAQFPGLSDYPDRRDVVRFLCTE